MSTVATNIKLSIGSLFGASGRYYEFSHPLELIVEQDAEGYWIHSIWEFNIWTVEPDREASLRALLECFDEIYEVYALAPDAELMQSAVAFKQKILKAIKRVR